MVFWPQSLAVRPVLQVLPPELDNRDSEQNEAPIIQGEMVNALLHQLDMHKSMGPHKGTDAVEELAKPLSIIHQKPWLIGEVLAEWR